MKNVIPRCLLFVALGGLLHCSPASDAPPCAAARSSAACSSSSSASVSPAGGSVGRGSSSPIVMIDGQSNAAVALPPSIQYVSVDLLTWDGKAWVQGYPHVVAYEPQGLGSMGGHVTRSLMQGDGIGRAINTAEGGQEIGHFLPSSSEVAFIYDTTPDPHGRNNYELTRDFWTDSGIEPRVICWSQGESDPGRTQEDQQADLEALIGAWWTDYPELERIVIVQTAQASPQPGVCTLSSEGVRAAEQAVAKRTNGVFLVTVDDLTVLPASGSYDDSPTFDGCHYKFPGYEAIAERILAALDERR